MIIVTGTPRSGTSLWMQILKAAGCPVLGEPFPAPWGAQLEQANPRGFYESQLLAGIYYATNPHPETGAYLHPEETRGLAVKVFIPGLVRSDVAFLGRVIATARSWRSVARSMARMRALGTPGAAVTAQVPAALLWWFENFSLLRDRAIRRYPSQLIPYERLLADPESELAPILDWIGRAEALPAACAAVEGQLQRSDRGEPVPAAEREGLSDEQLGLFDELHARWLRGAPLDAAFIGRLNSLDRALRPLLHHHRRALQDELRARAGVTA